MCRHGRTCAKWKNASDVWLRLAYGVDMPQSSRMRRGLDEELRLRELYRETIGQVSEPPGTQSHPRLEWAAGSPDGFVDGDGIAEFKTHSIFQQGQWGEPGTDRVPDKYLLQGAWLMEVTGRRFVNYLVAFGRDLSKADGGGWVTEESAVYRLNDDSELRVRLVEYATKFMEEHVAARVSPGIPPVHNKRAWKRLSDERKGSEYARGQVDDNKTVGGDGGC